jgi:hypothetical protein
VSALIASVIANPVVDNEHYGYSLTICGLTSTTSMYGAKVSYTNA